jgi:hypothetical protein
MRPGSYSNDAMAVLVVVAQSLTVVVDGCVLVQPTSWLDKRNCHDGSKMLAWSRRPLERLE